MERREVIAAEEFVCAAADADSRHGGIGNDRIGSVVLCFKL